MAGNSNQNNYPRVGVSIVNYLNFNDTIRYINSFLLKQANVDLTIAVVDNFSPDESYVRLNEEFTGNSKVNLIRNLANSGYSNGNNKGIRLLESKGCEYILVSNSDIEIEDEFFLRKLTKEYMRLDKIAFISPVMLTKGKVRREFSAWKLPTQVKEIFNSTYVLRFLGNWYLRKFYYKIDINDNNARKVDCLPGSFFFGATKVFQDLDYFDENIFLYYEETILGLKVKNRDLQNYLVQDLCYNHFSGSSTDKSLSILEKHNQLLRS
ncbi:MAG: glycosyltransferase family 2 protein, partial [Bacteroidia bacterium]|nr:glycosyltransferase family 2 protein [Bacteroidia bacterium]